MKKGKLPEGLSLKNEPDSCVVGAAGVIKYRFNQRKKMKGERSYL